MKNYSLFIYLTAMGMSVQNTTQLFYTDYAIDNNRLVTSSTYEFEIAVFYLFLAMLEKLYKLPNIIDCRIEFLVINMGCCVAVRIRSAYN